MTKLDVVTAITSAILQSYRPTTDPTKTMQARGFQLFDMDGALQDIKRELSDPGKTVDHQVYIFTYDAAFVQQALGLDEISLEAAIDVNTVLKINP
jgi:hypothetical protein